MKIKKREKIFFITGLIVCLLSWRFFKTVIEAAQGVGDAPLDFSPNVVGFKLALFVSLGYAVLYYLIAFIGSEIRNRKNKSSN